MDVLARLNSGTFDVPYPPAPVMVIPLNVRVPAPETEMSEHPLGSVNFSAMVKLLKDAVPALNLNTPVEEEEVNVEGTSNSIALPSSPLMGYLFVPMVTGEVSKACADPERRITYVLLLSQANLPEEMLDSAFVHGHRWSPHMGVPR